MKLVVDNTHPIENRLQELHAEHVVGYAVHDLARSLDHARALAKSYPVLMAANAHAVSQVFKDFAEFWSDLSKKL